MTIENGIIGRTDLNRFSEIGTWEELARRADFSLSEVAKLCGVSVRTVQRHFRKHYDVCAGEWVRALRLEQAYARVVRGERVKVVALALGYKQLSHFSRAFKARFGVTPRKVRPFNSELGHARLREDLIPRLDRAPDESLHALC